MISLLFFLRKKKKISLGKETFFFFSLSLSFSSSFTHRHLTLQSGPPMLLQMSQNSRPHSCGAKFKNKTDHFKYAQILSTFCPYPFRVICIYYECDTAIKSSPNYLTCKMSHCHHSMKSLVGNAPHCITVTLMLIKKHLQMQLPIIKRKRTQIT